MDRLLVTRNRGSYILIAPDVEELCADEEQEVVGCEADEDCISFPVQGLVGVTVDLIKDSAKVRLEKYETGIK